VGPETTESVKPSMFNVHWDTDVLLRLITFVISLYSRKKNGENCTSFVNKSSCEFCVYHVKSEYNKFSNGRSDLQFSTGGMNGLRNKVLGKNEVRIFSVDILQIDSSKFCECRL